MKTLSYVLLAVLIVAGVMAYMRGLPSAPWSEPPVDQKQRVIRIGTEALYRPFNYFDDTGRLTGFDIDIARAICETEGLTCSFVSQDWDGLIPSLIAKKFDVIAASLSITPERKKAVAFTNRYYRTPIRFITAKNQTLVISPEGLKGKKIGAQRATTAAIYLNANFAGIADIKLYDTQQNGYLDLKSGRLDAMLSDAIMGWSWLLSDEGRGYAFRSESIYVDEGIGFAMRQDDQALVNVFNQGLNKILSNGTYDMIRQRYFPFDIY